MVAWFPCEIGDPVPQPQGSGALADGTTRLIIARTGRRPVRAIDRKHPDMAGDADARILRRRVLHTASDADGRALVCEEGVTGADLIEEIGE